MDSRTNLYEAIGKYIKDKEGCGFDDATTERISAGVVAFIWTQIYREPYEPLTVGFTRDEKKWWQFWK